jgi:hypothetical protein
VASFEFPEPIPGDSLESEYEREESEAELRNRLAELVKGK